MNLCLFFSFGSKTNGCRQTKERGDNYSDGRDGWGSYLLAISTELFGSTTPQLGRTQYFLGAVVLILNATFFSVGFFRLMCDVTGCVKGPKKV